MIGEASTIQRTGPTPLPAACGTDLSVYSTGDGVFNRNTSTYYNDGDSARTGYIGDSQVSQMEVRVSGVGTATFYWKVSSEQNCDWVEFYIDGVRQDRISGTVDWQQKSYPITGSGTHSLLWQYVKDTSGTSGSDAGWVDYLQWTGAASASASADWEEIEYTYDPSGRRIAKDVDGVVTKYLVACPEPVERDGDHCIAEYACPEPAEWDANDVLLRKFIYGPGVDQPICMIDVADANLALSLSNGAAYYYHYDALGSVVALSDSAGDTVQLYEYDVYGQVAASDPNHPNPFLFTGRRYDTETSLYYYRARYYNPTIGRFLQTDLIGYDGGMNMYGYCANNSLNCLDPLGLDWTFGTGPDDLLGFFWDGDGTMQRLTGTYNLDGVASEMEMRLADIQVDYVMDPCEPNKVVSVLFWYDGTSDEWWERPDDFDPVAGDREFVDVEMVEASVPPSWMPKPDGWTDEWVWEPTDDPIGGGRWWDPENPGDTWRPHPDSIDPGHGGDHYDPGKRQRRRGVKKQFVYGTVAAVVIGGVIIAFDIATGPSGEGLVGVKMITTALAL